LSEQRDWIALAADFAQRVLLNAVFRPADPVLRVALPPEKRLELENKLSSLPHEVFLADQGRNVSLLLHDPPEDDRPDRSEVRFPLHGGFAPDATSHFQQALITPASSVAPS
jgi:hypothetical protein